MHYLTIPKYMGIYCVWVYGQILDTHFLALWLMAIELARLLRGIKTFSIKRGHLPRQGAFSTLFHCGVERIFE